MKRVLLFVAIITVMGSLKQGEKKCPTEIVVRYYYKGKLVHKLEENFYITTKDPLNYDCGRHGKMHTFKSDSVRYSVY